MQRNEDRRNDDLIDLGAIAEETKGQGQVPFDLDGGLIKEPGLSDD